MPLAADDGHDLDAMAAAVDERTRLVIVCNPNNPTGVYRERRRDRALPRRAARGPRGAGGRGLLRVRGPPGRRPHHVAGPRAARTCWSRARSARPTASAACASATAWAAAGWIDALDRVRQPFNTNALAQAAALESLRHPAALERRVRETVAERARVHGARSRTRAGPSPPARATSSWSRRIRSGRRITGRPRAAPAPRRDRARRRVARVPRAPPGLDRDPGGEHGVPVGAGAARPPGPRETQPGRTPP